MKKGLLILIFLGLVLSLSVLAVTIENPLKAKNLIYYAGIGFIIISLAKGVIALLKQTVIK